MKTPRLSDSAWARYSKIISDFMDVDVGLQPILWKRFVDHPLAWGEDVGDTYVDIELKGLIEYNAFRVWPMSRGTISGEMDGQSLAILISKAVLQEGGYLNEGGYWEFDGPRDLFIINGNPYKASGDTEVCQAKDTPLMFLVILKREKQ